MKYLAHLHEIFLIVQYAVFQYSCILVVEVL